MKNNIHVLSRALIIDQSHMLLAYDPRLKPNHYYEPGCKFYYLPGGHVEFKESAKEAIIREIKEETGFDANVEKFIATVEHTFKGDEKCCHTHEINLIFKVNIPDLNYGDMIAQKEEHVAFNWMPLSYLDHLDLRPVQVKGAIYKWQGKSDRDIFWSMIR